MYDWISETCTFPTHYFTCDVMHCQNRSFDEGEDNASMV